MSTSDTQRTDDQERWILSEGGRYSVVASHFARDLERELAAANERIRRLEKAGNAMHHEMQYGTWRQGSPRKQAHSAMLAWHAEMGGRV